MTIRAALLSPTSPALKDAQALCGAFADQLPRW
jgi:hypothetical protein